MRIELINLHNWFTPPTMRGSNKIIRLHKLKVKGIKINSLTFKKNFSCLIILEGISKLLKRKNSF